MENDKDTGGNIWLWIVGGLLLLAVVILGVSMYNQSATSNIFNQTQLPQGGGPGVTQINLNDLTSNPDKYLNTKILTTGQIGTVYAGRVFTIHQPGAASDSGVLVLSKSVLNSNAKSGDNIQVMGSIVKLNTVQIQKELNMDLSSEVSLKYEGKPIIIADTLALQ